MTLIHNIVLRNKKNGGTDECSNHFKINSAINFPAMYLNAKKNEETFSI